MASRPGVVRVFSRQSLVLIFLVCFSMVGIAQAAVPPATFQTLPAPYTVGTRPFFVLATPLRTGSTLKDLIVANSNVDGKGGVTGTTISILLNSGTGTYTQAPGSPITVGNTPIGIAAGDFNGDSKPDLAVATAGNLQNGGTDAGSIKILAGNGDGTFQVPTTITVGSNPLGIYAADFNGDKKLDLVITNSDLFSATPCAASSVTVLLGNGIGGFAPATGSPLTSGLCPAGAAVVDLGNGHLDLVVVNNGGMNSTAPGSVSVFVGNGNGTFQPKVDYGVGVGPIFVAVADFGNGKQDVAVADAGDAGNGGTDQGGISILLGKGDGTLQPATLLTTLPGAFFVGAGDVNGDGKTDLVATTHSNAVNILFGNGVGTFQAPVFYSLSGKEGAMAIADLNGDNKLDVAVPDAKSNTLNVLLNNGDGTYPAPRGYVAGMNPQTLAIGPLRSSNTKLDIVTGNGNFCGNGNTQVTCTAPNLGILLGNGDGTFTSTAGVSALPATQTSAVGIADFNGDGKPDLVETENTNSGSGALRLVQGNGDGSFGTVTTIPNPSSNNPFAVAIGDFNGDTKLDFAATNFQGTAGTLLNNGTTGNPISGTTFPSVVGYGTNIGFPTGLAAANLDGHTTKPDLVLAENNQFCQLPCTGQSDNVAILLNNGSGTFPTEFDLTAGTFPRAVAAGRFKNSGTHGLDIAVANAGSNNVSIFLNNGDTTGAVSPFNATADHTYSVGTGTNPQSIAVGDFNKDGNMDLVIANSGPNNCNNACPANTISVLLGNGDGTFNAATEYTLLGSPSAVGVGDFNGDGFPDIAVTDQNGNLVTIVLNISGSVVGLASSLNPSNYGDSVTFTATVTPRVGNGTPTGTVTFKDNGGASPASTNVPMASGKATFTTNLLPGGSHSIIAVYSGDATFAAGASGALQQVVNQVASATSLTSSANPAAPGQAVKFSATVTPSAGVGAKGTVNFFDGSTLIGSGILNASEVATFTDSALAIGSHSITAVYVGDGNFIGSTSAVLTQVIQPAATNTNLVSSANPSPQGQNVTFTATVSSGSGTPTGNVTFEDGGVAMGPAVTLASGVAMFSTSTLSSGAHNITAVYAGAASFNGSTSNTVGEIITSSGVTPSTTGVTVAITPSRLGEPLNTVRLEQNERFTVTVGGNGVLTPTGNAVLQDQVKGVTIGTQALNGSGIAVFNLRGLAIGAHSFVAIYTGDSTYAGSSSNAFPILIQASPKPR